jgi:hypothetical protein
MRKRKSLKDMVRLARFERATPWFVARYSIQLSYRRVTGGTIGKKSFRVKGLYPVSGFPRGGTGYR